MFAASCLWYGVLQKVLLTSTGTFRDHIKTEVLSRQPASAYMNRRDSLFLRNILGSFLEYRTSALYGAHAVLPAHINKIAHVLVSVSGETSPEQRSVWVRRVIEALVDSCKTPGACKLAYNPTGKSISMITSSSGRQEALSIAAIMGRKDIVTALTAEQGVSMWEKTSTGSDFGCALELATQTDNLDLVETLLSNAQRSTVKKVMKLQTGTVLRGIACAVQGNEPIALVLLAWYFSNVQRTDIYHLTDWFEKGCLFGMSRFLSKLIELSTPRTRDAFRAKFFRMNDPYCYVSGRRHHRNIQQFDIVIPFLFTTGLFNRTNINACEPDEGFIGVTAGGLLDIAVRGGNLAVILHVLDAGAHADGIFSKARGTMSYPLRDAVQRKRFDIVEMLIKYGADPNSDLYAQDAR